VSKIMMLLLDMFCWREDIEHG